jgi:hypothetical protein
MPVIRLQTEPSERNEGTLVRVCWPDSPGSIVADSRDRFLQIAEDYAWLNPHTTITVDWFGERSVIEATDPSWDNWKPSLPTSPHWYDCPRLERLVAGYVAHDADVGRARTVREFVTEYRRIQKQVLVRAQINEVLARLKNEPDPRVPDDLLGQIEDRLLADPTLRWDAALRAIVEGAAP